MNDLAESILELFAEYGDIARTERIGLHIIKPADITEKNQAKWLRIKADSARHEQQKARKAAWQRAKYNQEKQLKEAA